MIRIAILRFTKSSDAALAAGFKKLLTPQPIHEMLTRQQEEPMGHFPEKYQLDITYDEAQLLQSAVFKATGNTIQDFNEPRNAALRDLWIRIGNLVSVERGIRHAADDCAKWGSD
jgi:hypothetical protein